MNLFASKTQHMIGLDIGTRYVKAVLLEKSGEQYTITGVACEAIAGNAFSERDIKDFEAVSFALKKLKMSLKVKNKWVAIAVSGSTVLNKIVHMEPGQSDFELESQIELEADSLIPYPLNEVYLDFEALGPSSKRTGKVDVLLTSVHRDIVDRRTTLLGEVGFEAKIVDVESYALGTAISQFYEAQPEQTVCCINVGASQLQFCAVKNGQTIYTKDHNYGSDALIQDLMMLFSQDREHIEQQLTDGTLPESWLHDSYPMFIANLQQHISRGLQLFVSTTQEPQPTHLLICGGAGHLSRLVGDLSSDLGITVEGFNPFDKMLQHDKLPPNLLERFAPQLVIAAGLASRSFQPWHT
jgi:type IV pilus assembly protein PilM